MADISFAGAAAAYANSSAVKGAGAAGATAQSPVGGTSFGDLIGEALDAARGERTACGTEPAALGRKRRLCLAIAFRAAERDGRDIVEAVDPQDLLDQIGLAVDVGAP